MSLPLSRLAVALCSAGAVVLAGGVAAVAASAPSSVSDVVGDDASEAPVPSPSPSVGDDDGEGDVGDEGPQEGEDDGAQDAGDSDTGDEGAEDEGTEDDDPAKSRGVGPDAAGPAHHGLCTAWAHVQLAAGKAAESTAFRNLQEVGCDDVVTDEEPPVEEAPEEGTTPSTDTATTTKTKTKTKADASAKTKVKAKAKTKTKAKASSGHRKGNGRR